ncbi:protein suppressor of forked-like [Diaphorina citri]|uniref:Protein suppressor of forked-like n=1 Tax=Diaphorina citri TaxID=121845 RepID=A0A3Q0JFW4_DIACI|nr:protein suppressor of forked-like [Diaphorina citri]
MTEEKIITAVEWANEKLRRAQSAINENPWDIEAWGILIREAQTRWINEVRPFFEQLVTTYPTTGRYWKIYIEQEVGYYIAYEQSINPIIAEKIILVAIN